MVSRRWLLASIIGLFAFLWIQIAPGIRTLFTDGELNVLTRAEAEAQAFRIAQDRWGIAPDEVSKALLAHVSDSEAVAYLESERLSEDYGKAWDDRFPTDSYRADLKLRDGGWLRLMLHMETGKLVGWMRLGDGEAPSDDRSEGRLPASGGEQKNTASGDDRSVDRKELTQFLAQWGYDPDEWESTGEMTAGGDYIFQSRKAPIGEARLELLVKPNDMVMYRLEPPASFADYLTKHEDRATRLSMLGFLLPQLILFVLAISYAVQQRRRTSMRRGWLLSLIYFGLYACFTLNMIAGFRSRSGSFSGPYSEGTVEGLLILNALILAATAGLAYFSAVGGDGLWKAMGYSLWPRWKERGFGDEVLRSMKQGYALGLLILGVQSVIYVGLELWLGSFTGSDASQSSYNMTYPWLLPALAWCAGISEELVYRLFGIALFRWWLLGLARGITGREPSRRTANALTFLAMLPPSLFWAFGHVGYPIYPVQSRVIELVIIGVLFGWLMLRFGLMAVIFAHVTLDAILMSVQLFFDGLPYDPVSGIVSILLPAIVGVAIWKLHGLYSKRRTA